MNILIIGNGFDLAHKLPTQYSDFLKICSLVKSMEVSWLGKDVLVSKGIGENAELLKIFVECVGSELYAEFEKKVRHCFWIEHLLKRQAIIGGKWLNFEEEIKLVVESVIKDMQDADDEIVRSVRNESLQAHCKGISFYRDNKTFRELFELVMKEHNKLTRLLEIYMSGYVEKIEIESLDLFRNLLIDKVLSFNYTDTYAGTYDKQMECCQIHGEADEDKNKPCNMVLGYDDHYMNGASVVPELVPFEKYCQRIVNRTDSQYFEWLDSMEKDENMVYIYGHSLAPADGDVLGKFILAPNTKTTIYYINELDRADKIKNLAIILGPDKLIKLTGGINPAITFEEIKRL